VRVYWVWGLRVCVCVCRDRAIKGGGDQGRGILLVLVAVVQTTVVPSLWYRELVYTVAGTIGFSLSKFTRAFIIYYTARRNDIVRSGPCIYIHMILYDTLFICSYERMGFLFTFWHFMYILIPTYILYLYPIYYFFLLSMWRLYSDYDECIIFREGDLQQHERVP